MKTRHFPISHLKQANMPTYSTCAVGTKTGLEIDHAIFTFIFVIGFCIVFIPRDFHLL